MVIGLGRFGRHMAKKLQENGNEIMAVDISEERADAAVGLVQQIVIGDATDGRFMKSLGVENFDLAVVAVADNFQTALEITVLLDDLGCKYIVARATREVHKKLLLRNGADYVSYAEKEVAERLAIRFGSNSIHNYVELTPEIGIYEMDVPKKWIGKNMVELAIRTKYHVNVMATKKGDEIFPLPSPTHVFTEDESVMVMGAMDAINYIAD